MKPPPLAFGNHTFLNSVGDLSSRLREYDVKRQIHIPDAPKGFNGYMASAQIGNLDFLAFSHTPVTVEANEEPGYAVMIPCHGGFTISTKQNTFTAHAGHNLAFLAGYANTIRTGVESHVITKIDPERLLNTARAMLGIEHSASLVLDLHQREVSVNPPGLAMGDVLSTIFLTIDKLPTANLALLGLDDLFYRTLVTIISPQAAAALMAPAPKRQARHLKPEIELVCDYILAHLEYPISLTGLEQVSGLSARSLQLAFQKHFQCTPMQWVRQARLELARRRLLQALPGTTVSMIALDCGFTQFGAFAKAYQERYGELPSTTLRRQRA